jgi:hypothetical protein
MNLALRFLTLLAILAGLAIGCASGGGGENSAASGAQQQAAPKAAQKGPQQKATQKPSSKAAQSSTSKQGAGKAPEDKPGDKPAKKDEPAKTDKPGQKGESDDKFAKDAFPPTVSDVEYHKTAWYKNDCLRCHETGVGDAPMALHKTMLSDAQRAILKTAKCRSCHVLIPNSKPIEPKKQHDPRFEPDAFPPMIPASPSHRGAWKREDCMLCHEDGLRGAPDRQAREHALLCPAQDPPHRQVPQLPRAGARSREPARPSRSLR